MRRAKRRSSRALVAVLAITVAAGSFAAYKKFKSSPIPGAPLVAVDQPGKASTLHPSPLLLKDGKPAEPLLRTQTPSLTSATPAQPPARQPAQTPAQTPSDPPSHVAPPIDHPAPPPVIPLSGNPLADGRARLDAGDLVGARALLSSAMAANQLSDSDADAARDLLGKISQDLVFSRKIHKEDPHCIAYTVQLGDRLQKLAYSNDITWELLCRVNGISDPRKVRAGQTIKVIKGPFHAVVTKSRFVMDIYLGLPGESGSVFIRSFKVGLGKDDSTPAGKWLVEPHKKLRNPTYYSPRGEGIIAAGDPKNPLGPFWLGLAGLEGQAVGKASYGIHGTIDPDSIGKQESMGCIRMHNEDVAIVFELLVDGKSTVIVKD